MGSCGRQILVISMLVLILPFLLPQSEAFCTWQWRYLCAFPPDPDTQRHASKLLSPPVQAPRCVTSSLCFDPDHRRLLWVKPAIKSEDETVITSSWLNSTWSNCFSMCALTPVWTCSCIFLTASDSLSVASRRFRTAFSRKSAVPPLDAVRLALSSVISLWKY